MKKRLTFSLFALTLPVVTWANIIPTGTTVTGTGPYTWSYVLQLSQDQNVNSGLAPTSNPVPHENLTFAGFLTLYDFGGYIPGTCTGPAGWTCTTQNLGFTPDDVVPNDDPNLVNITWAYTSGPTILGQPSGMNLGVFSAQSTMNGPGQVSYAARGTKNIGASAGTIADNVGSVTAPSFLDLDIETPIPEPMTVTYLGAGLVALALIRRRAA